MGDSASGTIIKNEELCTTGSDHVVITWVTPGRLSDTTMYFGEDPGRLIKYTFTTNTEFHWAELAGLKPFTRYWYQVESDGVRGSLNSFTTLPKPVGELLFSFAILSDTHITYGDSINDINEIYFGKLSEYSSALLTQSIQDSKRRNIDLAVITGDLTDSSSQLQYLRLLNESLPYFGNTPYLLCIGNHDKYLKDSGLGEQGFLKYVANRETTFANVIFGDYQFLLIDSCRQDENLGYIDPVQMQWIESMLKGSSARLSFLFLHHPSNGLDVWFGLKNRREFQKTISPFSNIQGVFCGHMHRNKVTTNRFVTGNIPYVEVPATGQFPCAYAIVRVYEKGFEYNSYKVSRLDLSEMSRDRLILKYGGKAHLAWYGFGGIDDRSFSYFNGRLHCPKQYELSITVDHAKGIELYENAQSFGGASLAPAAVTSKSKVILGRYESPYTAMRAQRQQYFRYGVNAQIVREGSYDVSEEVKSHIK